jgi:hypothetical protein
LSRATLRRSAPLCARCRGAIEQPALFAIQAEEREYERKEAAHWIARCRGTLQAAAETAERAERDRAVSFRAGAA